MWKPKRLLQLSRRERYVSPSKSFRFQDSVFRCDLSADGTKFVAIAPRITKGIKPRDALWSAWIGDVDFGTMRDFSSKNRSLSCCAMAASGDSFATGSTDGTIEVWNVARSETKISTPSDGNSVSDIAFSRREDKIAYCGRTEFSGIVKVWDVSAGSPFQESLLSKDDSFRVIDMSADANIVYAGGVNKGVRAWDLRSQDDFVLEHRKESISGISVSEDGTLLASCSQNGKLQLWDVRRRAQFFEKDLRTVLYSCAMTPDACRVITCGDRGKSFIFERKNPHEILRLGDASSNMDIFSCGISHAGDRVVTTSGGIPGYGIPGYVRLFDVPSSFLTYREDDKDLGDSNVIIIEDDGDPQAEEKDFYSREIEEVWDLAMQRSQLRIESSDSSSVQQTSTLTSTKFVSALRNKNGDSNILSFIDIYRAHIVLRTMLDYGFSFSEYQNDESFGQNSFFYDNLYVRLSTVVQSRHQRDFAYKMLDDAVQRNILTWVQRDIIYGDIEVMQETEARLNSLQDVLAGMFSSVKSRLRDLEAGHGRTVEALEELQVERNREKRIAMGAAWVKLGLSLIPVAGPVAMSVAGMTGEILLSFSPKDIVDMCSGVLGGLTDVAIEHIGPGNDNETGTGFDDGQGKGRRKASREEYAIRLVEVALSEDALKDMPPSDRRALLGAIRKHYGMSLEEMRKDAHDAAAKQYCLDEDVYERLSMPVSEEEPHGDSGGSDGNDIESGDFAGQSDKCLLEQADTSLRYDNDECVMEVESNLHGGGEQIENGQRNALDCASDIVLSNASSEETNKLPPPGIEKVTVEDFSICEVAELFSNFVCKTISKGSIAEIRNRIRENVEKKMMAGRGVMSSRISAEKVARTALYGNSKNVEDLDTDFSYLELVDFIEKLRRGEVNFYR